MIIQKQNGETTVHCAGLPHCHRDHCSLVSPLVTVQITESFARTRQQSSRQKCECVSAQVRASTVRRSTAQYSAVQSTVQPGELRRGDHGTSGTAELQVAAVYYQAWSASYRATGSCDTVGEGRHVSSIIQNRMNV